MERVRCLRYKEEMVTKKEKEREREKEKERKSAKATVL